MAISAVVANGSRPNLMTAFQPAWQAAANSTAAKTKESIGGPSVSAALCRYDSSRPRCALHRVEREDRPPYMLEGEQAVVGRGDPDAIERHRRLSDRRKAGPVMDARLQQQ